MARLQAFALFVGFLVSAGVAAAQQSDVRIRSNVSVVLAPVTVTDGKGRFVNGLSQADFVLYDGDQRRPIELEYSETFAPIAVAIVVQTTEASAPVLAKLNKVGSLIQPLVTGERGAAAVLAYDEHIRVVCDFTSEPGAIIDAFRSITPQSSGKARTLDAVAEAARMLSRRPQGVRKIIILVSESRDRGSETDLAGAIAAASSDAIAIYPAVFSVHRSPWTVKGGELPPAEGGFNPLAAITEVARLGKVNASEALARGTGGRVLSFNTLPGLERTIASFGEELHSQYLLSFYPAATEPGVYRTIRVEIPGHPNANVRARPGYMLAQ